MCHCRAPGQFGDNEGGQCCGLADNSAMRRWSRLGFTGVVERDCVRDGVRQVLPRFMSPLKGAIHPATIHYNPQVTVTMELLDARRRPLVRLLSVKILVLQR
jgi:hypothetical protein